MERGEIWRSAFLFLQKTWPEAVETVDLHCPFYRIFDQIASNLNKSIIITNGTSIIFKSRLGDKENIFIKVEEGVEPMLTGPVADTWCGSESKTVHRAMISSYLEPCRKWDPLLYTVSSGEKPVYATRHFSNNSLLYVVLPRKFRYPLLEMDEKCNSLAVLNNCISNDGFVPDSFRIYVNFTVKRENEQGVYSQILYGLLHYLKFFDGDAEQVTATLSAIFIQYSNFKNHFIIASDAQFFSILNTIATLKNISINVYKYKVQKNHKSCNWIFKNTHCCLLYQVFETDLIDRMCVIDIVIQNQDVYFFYNKKISTNFKIIRTTLKCFNVMTLCEFLNIEYVDTFSSDLESLFLNVPEQNIFAYSMFFLESKNLNNPTILHFNSLKSVESANKFFVFKQRKEFFFCLVTTTICLDVSQKQETVLKFCPFTEKVSNPPHRILISNPRQCFCSELLYVNSKKGVSRAIGNGRSHFRIVNLLRITGLNSSRVDQLIELASIFSRGVFDIESLHKSLKPYCEPTGTNIFENAGGGHCLNTFISQQIPYLVGFVSNVPPLKDICLLWDQTIGFGNSLTADVCLSDFQNFKSNLSAYNKHDITMFLDSLCSLLRADLLPPKDLVKVFKLSPNEATSDIQYMVDQFMLNLFEQLFCSSVIKTLIFNDLFSKIDHLEKELETHCLGDFKMLKDQLVKTSKTFPVFGWYSSSYDSIILEPYMERFAINNPQITRLPTSYTRGNKILHLQFGK